MAAIPQWCYDSLVPHRSVHSMQGAVHCAAMALQGGSVTFRGACIPQLYAFCSIIEEDGALSAGITPVQEPQGLH
jgi:hypothetical protein